MYIKVLLLKCGGNSINPSVVCTLQMGHDMKPNVIRGPSQRFSRTRRVHWRWNTCVQSSWKQTKQLDITRRQRDISEVKVFDSGLPVLQEQRRELQWSRSYTCHLHPVSDNQRSYHSRTGTAGRCPRSSRLHTSVHRGESYCRPA